MFRNVTTRDTRRSRHPPSTVCSPSALPVRHHISDSAPATSTVRQPAAVPQPTRSSTTSSVRHHRDRHPSPSSSSGSMRQRHTVPDQRQFIRRHLYDDAGVSKFDEGRHAVLSSVCVQDEKCSSVAEGSETKPKLSSKPKCDKAVSVSDSRVNAVSRLRKPSCSTSDSECSSSAKSAVSVGENVSKRAITRAVVSGDSVKKSSVGKSTAEKSRDKRPRRRKSSVRADFETESDDKSCAVDRRRAYIKPDKFNGITPTFATFKAQFMNAAKFNKWNDDEQLAFLKSSLTGSAAQCLWDQDESCTDTLDKLWKLLADRFAGQNLTEKYRTEVRSRRRKPGESLDALCQDIRRLLILGYPGPSSSAHEAIAKDSFIDALSGELSIKVRERDPSTLESALHVALRLEAIHEAAAVRDASEDNNRAKGRARGVAVNDDRTTNNEILSTLQRMQSQLDADRRAFSGRLDSLESAMRHPTSSNGQQQLISNRPSAPRAWSATSQSSNGSPTSTNNGQNTSTATSGVQSTTPRACYNCGDPTHLRRQCPNARNVNGRRWQTGSANTDTEPVQPGGPAAAASRGLHGQLDNGHVYLAVYMGNKRHLALLDSGCELSLAPSNVVGNKRLRPTSQRVHAANGSPIEILGETEIEFSFGGRMSGATVLVSPDVSELMLGITWLTAKGGVWDFANRTLYVDGEAVMLHSQKTAALYRRVYVQQDVVIPPQQLDVPIRSTVNNITVSESNDWLLETKQLRPGVLVARTVLPDQHRDIAVRVVNTTTEPQELRREVCLGNLEAIEVCKQSNVDNNSVSSACSMNSTSSHSDTMSEMLRSLPDELTEEQRDTVAAVLCEYEDVFSKGV